MARSRLVEIIEKKKIIFSGLFIYTYCVRRLFSHLLAITRVSVTYLCYFIQSIKIASVLADTMLSDQGRVPLFLKCSWSI